MKSHKEFDILCSECGKFLFRIKIILPTSKTGNVDLTTSPLFLPLLFKSNGGIWKFFNKYSGKRDYRVFCRPCLEKNFSKFKEVLKREGGSQLEVLYSVMHII